MQNMMTRSWGRAVLKTKKNSPHIFFTVGLVGAVGSTVLACRATLKLEKTIDDIKAEFAQIRSMKDHWDHGDGPQYDQDEYVRDLTTAYLRGIAKLARLYGPAAIVGVISIGCLTGSHVQLTKRNAGLTAALTAVSKAYDEYRTRVKEVVGEKKEQEIFQACLMDSDELDKANETGKITLGSSPYGRFFEASNINWHNNPEINRVYIEAQQRYANHLLNARGHVFLNDVYDALGFDRTPAGAVVGWIRDPENGDGYIDFGLYHLININFIDAGTASCFLDFNVDGVIFELI